MEEYEVLMQAVRKLDTIRHGIMAANGNSTTPATAMICRAQLYLEKQAAAILKRGMEVNA